MVILVTTGTIQKGTKEQVAVKRGDASFKRNERRKCAKARAKATSGRMDQRCSPSQQEGLHQEKTMQKSVRRADRRGRHRLLIERRRVVEGLMQLVSSQSGTGQDPKHRRAGLHSLIAGSTLYGVASSFSRGTVADGDKSEQKTQEGSVDKQWVAVNPQGSPTATSNTRSVEDGILLIVPVQVYGHQVHALIDSGATRCYMAPELQTAAGIHCTESNTLLELADGSKILSGGKAPSVLFSVGSSTTRMDFTVTRLLHGVELVLGMTWLQRVNPLIDWAGPRMFVGSDDQLSPVHGHWLDSTEQPGTVKVLQDTEAETIRDPQFCSTLEVLQTPTFWRYASSCLPWRAKDLKRGVASTAEEPKEQTEKKRKKKVLRIPHPGEPARPKKSKLASQRVLVSHKQFAKILMRSRQTPAFFAIVKSVDDDEVPEDVNEGMTALQRKKLMKEKGPKQNIDFKSVEDQRETVLSELPESQRGPLRRLLEKHSSVFPDALPKGAPPRRSVEHQIDLVEGAVPKSKPPYRLGPKEQDEMETQIKDLLDQGFIRPSISPWGAPVLFVPKKDGRWRMCIDYRALNKDTVKDRFPVPRIDELLDRLGRAKYFTKLDLASGYHQIGVARGDIAKTAFRTNRGSYEFIVMPFGLTNAPATFQRLINGVFAKEINDFVLVYLDDILIFSETLEDHWKHLDIALQRLKDAKLFGRIHKCDFLKEEVEYLGFRISKDGISTDPSKVQAVVQWPTPTSVRDVRSFLGLASYYRRFIRNFSLIAKPLTDLTKNAVKWQWEEEQEHAFVQIKVALVSAPVLRIPDFGKEFVLTTDASLVSVGAILQQNFGEGVQPVAYASRKFNPTECRYSAYERELLAIVWAIGLWRPYLDSGHFIVQSDHSSLRHLPNQASTNRRVWKWISVMQSYDCTIEHIPGKTNPADGLSRRHWDEERDVADVARDQDDQLVELLRVREDASDEDIRKALDKVFKKKTPQARTQAIEEFSHSLGGTSRDADEHHILLEEDPGERDFFFPSPKLMVTKSTVTVDQALLREMMVKLRLEDPYADIISKLENETHEVRQGSLKYRIRHGNLTVHRGDRDDGRYWKLVVPASTDIKSRILRELHTVPYAGHPGYMRTVEIVHTHFYWVGMSKDVRAYVEECPVCQIEKGDHTKKRGKLQNLQLPAEKWQEVTLDFIFKLPRTASGFDGIMTVVDRATKMAHLIPCKETMTARDVARLYWARVGCLHGVPRAIYSDRDVRFTGSFWRGLWSNLGTDVRMSTAHHPQTQGLVERTNQTVEQVLRCLIHQLEEVREWDQLLPTVEFVLNAYPNRSTGYSPFYLNWGYEPVTPQTFLRDRQQILNESVSQFLSRMGNIFSKSQANVQRANDQMKARYDTRRREIEFKVGDWVLVSTENMHRQGTPHKLQRRFIGPFKVGVRYGRVAYELVVPDTWRRHNVFHVSLLKPFKSGVFEPARGGGSDGDDDDADSFPDVTGLPKDEDPDIDKLIRWRKVKQGNQIRTQYLVTWMDQPIEEATWLDSRVFTDQEELRTLLEEGQPTKDPSSL
jgi:hypothetical protein